MTTKRKDLQDVLNMSEEKAREKRVAIHGKYLEINEKIKKQRKEVQEAFNSGAYDDIEFSIDTLDYLVSEKARIVNALDLLDWHLRTFRK